MDKLDKHVDTLVEFIALFEMRYGSQMTLYILESIAREIEVTIENEGASDAS
jgi:hypothetical protein